MSSYDEQKGIYLGSRGADFKDLINGVLKKGNLKNMSLYRNVSENKYQDEMANE